MSPHHPKYEVGKIKEIASRLEHTRSQRPKSLQPVLSAVSFCHFLMAQHRGKFVVSTDEQGKSGLGLEGGSIPRRGGDSTLATCPTSF